MTRERLTISQAILTKIPDVCLRSCTVLNPATLLPVTQQIEPECEQTVAWNHVSILICGTTITGLAGTGFTDGSSSIREGIRRADHPVVSPAQVTGSKGLPLGTSAQKTELVALTWALQLAQGQRTFD